MRIKFLKDYTVKDADGTTHKKGSEIDCPDSSAWHFIHRGAAEAVTAKAAPAPKAEAKADK